MNDVFEPITHPETGEVLNEPEVPARQEAAGTDLNEAIHAIIKELPVWITQDSSAAITDKIKRKYATLKAILTVVRPIATKHGVRIRQGCEHAWSLDGGTAKGRAVPVTTDLIHTGSGQYERTTIEIPLMKMDAQAMGSAISYGRRYGLLAALGLTTDEAEDDGASTKGRDLSEQGEEEESQALWEIRAEIRECSTLDELGKVGEKIKTKGKLEKLTDAEMALARVAFKDRRKEIEKAADEPKKVK